MATVYLFICQLWYSLAIFYAYVKIIGIIPNIYLRWAVVSLAGLISTLFLLSNTYARLKSGNVQTVSQLGKGMICMCLFNLIVGIFVIILMGLLHIGFALTTQLYFFQY